MNGRTARAVKVEGRTVSYWKLYHYNDSIGCVILSIHFEMDKRIFTSYI